MSTFIILELVLPLVHVTATVTEWKPITELIRDQILYSRILKFIEYKNQNEP